MPQLIVNADDFGLTSGVNRAILELHQAGLVTSTTLMARAGASDEAIAMARVMPTLGVGCHIVLADGESALPVDQVPSLIDAATGKLFPTLRTFVPRLAMCRLRSVEIEAEARAQIQLLQKTGLPLTHIDTHKHTHMFPRVLRPVLRAARSCGITRIRNPFEPAWAVRATTSAGPMRIAQVGILRCFQPIWRRILAEEAFTTTDGTLAVAGTGVLDANMLRRILRNIPEGRWELVTHPGYNDADLAGVRTRLRASRDTERQALATLREFPALELVSFAKLTR